MNALLTPGSNNADQTAPTAESAASGNTALVRDVRAALSWEPGLDPASIAVTADGGAISLHGSVETLMNKFAAIDAARRVRGVTTVTALLSVLLPSSKRSADENILEAANATLAWDASLAPHRVEVELDRGWITLSGKVSRQYQKEAAEQDVARLNGVLGVTNLIVVPPTLNVIGITDSIMRALHRTWLFDPKSVQVSAEGGAVCLTGEVRSPREKDLVVATAWAAPGVSSVKDDIRIGLAPQSQI